MNDDDINKYLPSILNPRGVRKQHGDLTLTQNSIVSRCSLSLKRRNGLSNVKKILHKTFPPGKENVQNGILSKSKNITENCTFDKDSLNLSLTWELCATFPPSKETPAINLQNGILSNVNNIAGNCAFDKDSLNLSLTQELRHTAPATGKENSKNVVNSPAHNKIPSKEKPVDEASVGLSAVEDLNTERRENNSSPFSFGEIIDPAIVNKEIDNNNNDGGKDTLIALSSDTELDDLDATKSTIAYELEEMPIISVSFGITNCESVNVSTKNTIKNFVVTHKDNDMNVDCDVQENSQMSVQSEEDDDVIEVSSEEEGPPKKRANVAVNLEIKKKNRDKNSGSLGNAENSSEDVTADTKVLILKTNAIEKLSHVIVQPPNYKLVKRKIPRSKFKNREFFSDGGVVRLDSLKQKRIDSYFTSSRGRVSGCRDVCEGEGRDEVMSKVPGAEGARGERSPPAHRSARRDLTGSPRSRGRNPATLKGTSSGQRTPQRTKEGNSKPSSPRKQADSLQSNVASKSATNDAAKHIPYHKYIAASPRKQVDSLQSNVAPKSATNETASAASKHIPYHKYIAGTHFAVDAFSYGDIPNVRHYFLTHFHSDHYSGLKKSFSKPLFCSKITAELCTTRLGVNAKCIHILNFDEIITIDGIDVMAVDANHCPGAIMLIFTLSNGKTLLHTGDFRASPHMESYPVFWNKDIHTVYLDSTYCNPRYDFPTQEQCLEMALYLLRQKKLTLEKAGKKFASVLIVCGTYTIGKEKFFMGMARRVGCNVWACPEKDKVLQAVEGKSFGTQPPNVCQLHVVPMRDLTHEKLRNYLDSLQGSFSEVVAFKPSGWENGKNSSVEKDLVTIHGIPYSEHSSFSEMIRFIKFLKPQQVIPTVEISGGIKAVQKYFPCPLVKEPQSAQSKVTDYFSIQQQQHVPAVT